MENVQKKIGQSAIGQSGICRSIESNSLSNFSGKFSGEFSGKKKGKDLDGNKNNSTKLLL